MKLVDHVEKLLSDLRNADARTQAESVLDVVLSAYRKEITGNPFKYDDVRMCLRRLIEMLETR